MNAILSNVFGAVVSLSLNSGNAGHLPTVEQIDLIPVERPVKLPDAERKPLTLQRDSCTADIADPQFYTIKAKPVAGEYYEEASQTDDSPESKMRDLARNSMIQGLSISIGHVFQFVSDGLTAEMLADPMKIQGLSDSLRNELAAQWFEQYGGRNPDIEIEFKIVADPARNGECIPGLDNRLPKYDVRSQHMTFGDIRDISL